MKLIVNDLVIAGVLIINTIDLSSLIEMKSSAAAAQRLAFFCKILKSCLAHDSIINIQLKKAYLQKNSFLQKKTCLA